MTITTGLICVAVFVYVFYLIERLK